jgi:hypothetical protein
MRPPDTDPTSRLLRDVARFQLKLWMEAARDLVLIPVSLAAAAIDLVFAKQSPPRLFREIIKLGRRSDDWIDLWGTVDADKKVENVDAVMARVERMLRDPRTGSRQARALVRWMEMTLSRQRRAAPGTSSEVATSEVTDPEVPAPQTPSPPPAPPSVS